MSDPVCANATELPFPDASFDASRSERMFQHLKDPDAVFGEMVRVTKPGGRIVVLDPDWGTASIDTPGLEEDRAPPGHALGVGRV